MDQNTRPDNADNVDFNSAIGFIRDRVDRLGSENRAVAAADGYVVAEPATALIDMPPVHISEKDGFAVRVGDGQVANASKSVTLAVRGQAVAGGCTPQAVEPGTAVRINTGAPLPRDADAVIATELCEHIRGDRISLNVQIAPGQDVLCRGAESRVGQVMVKTGTRLDPERIGTLVAAGVERVQVLRRPRVALIAIGDELVLPGTPITGCQRYASNAVMIAAYLARFDIDCGLRLTGDDAAQIGETIDEVSRDSDLITTIGGTGYSNRDFVVPVLERLGWAKLFRGVRMAPGKGSLLGMLKGTPVLGLPGGAPSSAMGFYQLLLPLVARLAGDETIGLPQVAAKLGHAIQRKNLGAELFLKGILLEEGGERIVRTEGLDRGASDANQKVVVRIPAGGRRLESRAPIQVQLL